MEINDEMECHILSSENLSRKQNILLFPALKNKASNIYSQKTVIKKNIYLRCLLFVLLLEIKVN